MQLLALQITGSNIVSTGVAQDIFGNILRSYILHLLFNNNRQLYAKGQLFNILGPNNLIAGADNCMGSLAAKHGLLRYSLTKFIGALTEVQANTDNLLRNAGC